jgi:protein-tyrosine phosphatase
MKDNSSHPDSFTELPFNLPGRVFRSPMPFQVDDLDGRLFQQYLEASVSVVVLLVTDEECMRRTGRILRFFYIENKMDVIYLPIPDYRVPAMVDLRSAVQDAISRAQAGRHQVVHCRAGVGRTGMFLACMAKQCLGLDGHDAIRWVRSYIPGALETSEQIRLAMDY